MAGVKIGLSRPCDPVAFFANKQGIGQSPMIFYKKYFSFFQRHKGSLYRTIIQNSLCQKILIYD